MNNFFFFSFIQEEIEQSRREWARERSELTAALGAADARSRDLADQLELLRAGLPADHPHHCMLDDGDSTHFATFYLYGSRFIPHI